MAQGGLHAYEVSQKLTADDTPFSALIFAAMRKADSVNIILLQNAFPELYAELHERYWAPGGKIGDEE